MIETITPFRIHCCDDRTTMLHQEEKKKRQNIVHKFFGFKSFAHLVEEFEYRVERIWYLMDRHQSQSPITLLAPFVKNPIYKEGEILQEYRRHESKRTQKGEVVKFLLLFLTTLTFILVNDIR